MTLPEAVHSIYGHLSVNEAELLYRLASEVPAGGKIVEIGSFQGKSTVCLGLGAKQAGAWVWAIDPHNDYQETEETHYGMENHAALLKNLVEFEVADTVRVVALPAVEIYAGRVNEDYSFPTQAIDLLWIDGLHDVESVKADLQWAHEVKATGKIILHDATDYFPGVQYALRDFLIHPYCQWKVADKIDAAVIMERSP